MNNFISGVFCALIGGGAIAGVQYKDQHDAEVFENKVKHAVVQIFDVRVEITAIWVERIVNLRESRIVEDRVGHSLILTSPAAADPPHIGRPGKPIGRENTPEDAGIEPKQADRARKHA